MENKPTLNEFTWAIQFPDGEVHNVKGTRLDVKSNGGLVIYSHFEPVNGAIIKLALNASQYVRVALIGFEVVPTDEMEIGNNKLLEELKSGS